VEDESSPVGVAVAHSPMVARAGRRARGRRWALNTIAIGVILTICSYAERALAVILISVLLAFILAPLVDGLMRLRLTRGLAAAIAVFLLLAVVGGVIYYSYNQATIFLNDLPRYTEEIRDYILKFRRQAASFEGFGEERGMVAGTNWTSILGILFGSVTDALLAISFIPFLVYFMLTWQQHVRSATVMLFRLEDRHSAYTTLGLISRMVRSFMVGNLLIGFFMGVVSTVVFGLLHIPFFYFVGFISGYVSLIPYLGVLLAMAPPLFVGIGQIHSGGFVVIVATVVALHLISLNVLYPKFLGRKLRLNPLAVTLALLLWAWMWGGIGMLLAVPITAGMKIVFDHVESLKPYGAWLGE
jgi:predicted PurR-regulated permease PerM